MIALPNTVRLRLPKGAPPTVDAGVVEDLSKYGDIARIDASLATVLGHILVTYYDVRSAHRMLLDHVGHAEPFSEVQQDCRIARVNMALFAEMVGTAGGFSRFGEVANIKVVGRDAIVEFFDLRAAQALLLATGGAAQPCLPAQGEAEQLTMAAHERAKLQQSQEATLAAIAAALAGSDGDGLAPPVGLDAATVAAAAAAAAANVMAGGSNAPPCLDSVPYPTFSLGGRRLSSLAEAALAAEEGNFFASCAPKTMSATGPAGKLEAALDRRPGRTKVTAKDFWKYDINRERVAAGEDTRTTVMVRNLVRDNARKDFLAFLERCGLGEKYTFFYMPCKEHRKVPAGFVIVNFVSPQDVLCLHDAVQNEPWAKCGKEQTQKTPAVSYARFQGHEELLVHFSTSAVLHETDPEKRPMCRTSTGELKALDKQLVDALLAGLPPGDLMSSSPATPEEEVLQQPQDLPSPGHGRVVTIPRPCEQAKAASLGDPSYIPLPTPVGSLGHVGGGGLVRKNKRLQKSAGVASLPSSPESGSDFDAMAAAAPQKLLGG